MKAKEKEKKRAKKRRSNQTKKNQSIEGHKKKGRQKLKIEVSPKERGEQHSLIPTTILERSHNIRLESPQILQGLATPVLQQLPSIRLGVFISKPGIE